MYLKRVNDSVTGGRKAEIYGHDPLFPISFL